jgi:DNA-binding beta-propeller fold protein YncE
MIFKFKHLTSCCSNPVHCCIVNAYIDTRRCGVVGVTSVDNRLFVLRVPSKQSVKVYDLKTLQQNTLKVKGLSSDSYNGLTACVVNKCLYVSDYKNATVNKVELAVDNKISMWLVDRGPRGLSINSAFNLLVACFKANKIQEYTTGGLLVREVCLKSYNDKLLSPFHVIQLTSGQFIVSCYEVTSLGHDVVELDADGKLLVSYTSQLQSTTKQNFRWPFHLAVDKTNECILVADNLNNRIVILSRSFTNRAREFNVMSVDGGLQCPSCLHFNESQGRLFVGEDSDLSGGGQRRVLVFDNVIDITNRFQ